MIISIFIFPSNAVTKLYPKATIKLPIKAFESDIVVYNKYIFYNIAYRDLDHYKTYSKDFIDADIKDEMCADFVLLDNVTV